MKSLRTVVLFLCVCILFIEWNFAALNSHLSSHSVKFQPSHASSTKAGPTALNMSIVSWNMAEKDPQFDQCGFIKGYRSSDIVIIGIQECEDIKPRRREGRRTRKWREIQRKYLGKSFKCISSHKMGGLFISIHAKQRATRAIQSLQVVDVACGVGNVLTNKGAVGVIMRIHNKTLALVNAHLAAHQKHVSISMICLYLNIYTTIQHCTNFAYCCILYYIILTVTLQYAILSTVQPSTLYHTILS